MASVQVTPYDRNTIVPPHYAQAASWLTYHEWNRLRERARNRAQAQLTTTTPKFSDALSASDIPGPVKFTLTVMHDLADSDSHISISKAALSNILGINERTITRHWRTAEANGFLTKYDYPMDQKRPSDMWLWAGNAPRRDTSWNRYDAGPMQDATEPFQGW